MDEALPLKFSHRFDGIVWNIVASDDVIVIEVRDPVRKQVTFSALDLVSGSFLWRDKTLEEVWWVSASAIAQGKILFTIYLDTNNPDKKGILAYDLKDLDLKWWNNDFSLSSVGESSLRGFTSRFGLKEVALHTGSGKEESPDSFVTRARSPWLLKPVQYSEGMEHFNTVIKFLADRLNFSGVSALEYLESGNVIVISAYKQEDEGLANYLFVLSAEGKVLLKEKVEGNLKGIGFDTFFVLRGCLIFVRNKVELVSYKII